MASSSGWEVGSSASSDSDSDGTVYGSDVAEVKAGSDESAGESGGAVDSDVSDGDSDGAGSGSSGSSDSAGLGDGSDAANAGID